MFKCTLVIFAALLACATSAPAGQLHYGQNESAINVFNPPKLVPFLHTTLRVNNPINVTTIDGIVNRASTVGGNVTGAFEADVLPVGASHEILSPASKGVHSLYKNQWTLNTTAGKTILMNGHAQLSYANEALHAFGTVSFQTNAPEYLDLNWRSFVVEFESFFRTGRGEVDVFELKDAGKKDGSPTLALEPPGGA